MQISGAMNKSTKPKHENQCVKCVFSRSEEQQRRAMIEEERKELRTWMRRKQRERLVEYHRQREEKRERERVPYTPPNPLVRLLLFVSCIYVLWLYSVPLVCS